MSTSTGSSAYWTEVAGDDDHRIYYSAADVPLPAHERAMIVRDLQDALPGYGIVQYYANQPTIFEDYDHCTLARNTDGRAIALLGTRWFDAPVEPFLYVWTAQVATGAQGSGLLVDLSVHLFDQVLKERGCPRLLAAKTYNPNVYDIFFGKFGPLDGVTLYPNLTGRQCSELEAIATATAHQLCPTLEFEATTGLLRGAQAGVGADFFPGMPVSRSVTTMEYFEEHVGKEDQLLCLARFDDLGAVSARRALDLLLTP